MELPDGRKLPYDKLLLATGTRVRKLTCPGADLPGVHYLRDIADVDGLQAAFQPGKRIAIVGGGYIGLEVAAVAAKRGLDVTVFEAMDRLMARAVSRAGVGFLCRRASQGRRETEAAHRRRSASKATARSNGCGPAARPMPPTLCWWASAWCPTTNWRRDAGLAVEDGIVVDQNGRPAIPRIFAAGDCTRHIGREGTAIRLECVQNAIDQAKHARPGDRGKAQDLSRSAVVLVGPV